MAEAHVDNDAGPDTNPPSLPPGWDRIAQWDASSRKYYYVQLSTGQSTWDLPTEAAPGVPTPDPTPSNTTGPYPPPATGGERGMAGEESDRGLGSTAMNFLSGSQSKPGQQQSGLGGLANQFLGGSHGGQYGGQGGSHSGGGGGLVGQIASGLLSGNKPHNQQQQQQQQQGTPGGSSGSHQSGLGGLVGGLLGGHGSHQQQNYGYTNHSSSGPYTGTAPPAAYQPSGSSQYGPTSGTYNPPGQQHQQQQYGGQPTHQPQQGYNQHSQPQHGQQSHSDYPGQSYHQQDHNLFRHLPAMISTISSNNIINTNKVDTLSNNTHLHLP
ncbi:hypothetical protein EV356DRAFT_302812 [Viridothelium virens]|uniref:WW domain-containing protein n=1 Tax=Viridothelium virens TaxID=1048519 RepID=A0A6A6HKB6_VIRVR|nr:hypothetical protein EV356DRAFT_302812 [Viridothelium virens]